MTMTRESNATWGIDVADENRPGVPKERQPASPYASAEKPPPQQETGRSRRALHHALRDDLTPAFGTGQPPRGLSGLLRRAAYSIPDHRTGHWLMLILADRVDVQESRVRRLFRSPLFWVAAAGVGALALKMRVR